MCACFPEWLIERGYYIWSALNDSNIGGLVTGAKWLGDVQIVGKAQRDVTRKIKGWGVGVSCSLSCSPSFFFPAFRLRAALHCLNASNRLSKILISMPDIARFVCYSFNWSLRGGEAAKIRYDPSIWQKDRWPPVTYPGWSKLLGCKNEKSVLAKRQIDCYFGVRDFKKYQFAKSACLFWI